MQADIQEALKIRQRIQMTDPTKEARAPRCHRRCSLNDHSLMPATARSLRIMNACLVSFATASLRLLRGAPQLFKKELESAIQLRDEIKYAARLEAPFVV